jgi:hypothetical protein
MDGKWAGITFSDTLNIDQKSVLLRGLIVKH